MGTPVLGGTHARDAEAKLPGGESCFGLWRQRGLPILCYTGRASPHRRPNRNAFVRVLSSTGFSLCDFGFALAENPTDEVCATKTRF